MQSVTVLMTVYNGMPYLKESLRSLFEQSTGDFCIFVINNGSTDGGGQYLDRLEKERTATLPRLKVLHLPENMGRTAALNKGLALVETEITAVLDADDLAMPQRIAAQSAFLLAHPEVDLVGSDIVYINGAGAHISNERFPETHDDLRDNLPLHNQFAHSACAYRTESARRAGGYPIEYPYAQDMGLWIALLRLGSKVASIREVLAGIRVHPGQITKDLTLLMVRAKDNYHLSQAMLDIPGLSKAARQAARFRSAGALMRLGDKKQAMEQIWRGICEAPCLLPCNPLLWKRLAHECRLRFQR